MPIKRIGGGRGNHTPSMHRSGLQKFPGGYILENRDGFKRAYKGLAYLQNNKKNEPDVFLLSKEL